MTILQTEMIIEALLFASGEAVPVSKIAKTIDESHGTTKKIIKNLSDKYETENRGIVIIEVDDSYQMCTNPIYFDYIEKHFKTNKKQVLSQTLVETLAIIAYKQPITKMQIEEIRGVSSDHAVNKLVEFNLVCEAGRLNSPGRPILFKTTEDFLKYFGYKNLGELPILAEDFEALREQAYKEIDDAL